MCERFASRKWAGASQSGSRIFNDSEEGGSARERVLRILRGFRLDNAIPPVEIVAGQYPYRYSWFMVRIASTVR